MAETDTAGPWEPIGIRWGAVYDIVYPMGRHHGLEDLSSLLALDEPIDSLSDNTGPLRIEPPKPTAGGGAPPPLPPPLPR